jgi:hypothetical protein
MLLRGALSLFGLFGVAAMFLRSRQRRRAVAQVRTWQCRDEIERMDSSTLNEFLATRGLDVRVVDDTAETRAV